MACTESELSGVSNRANNFDSEVSGSVPPWAEYESGMRCGMSCCGG